MDSPVNSFNISSKHPKLIDFVDYTLRLAFEIAVYPPVDNAFTSRKEGGPEPYVANLHYSGLMGQMCKEYELGEPDKFLQIHEYASKRLLLDKAKLVIDRTKNEKKISDDVVAKLTTLTETIEQVQTKYLQVGNRATLFDHLFLDYRLENNELSSSLDASKNGHLATTEALNLINGLLLASFGAFINPVRPNRFGQAEERTVESIPDIAHLKKYVAGAKEFASPSTQEKTTQQSMYGMLNDVDNDELKKQFNFILGSAQKISGNYARLYKAPVDGGILRVLHENGFVLKSNKYIPFTVRNFSNNNLYHSNRVAPLRH